MENKKLYKLSEAIEVIFEQRMDDIVKITGHSYNQISSIKHRYHKGTLRIESRITFVKEFGFVEVDEFMFIVPDHLSIKFIT